MVLAIVAGALVGMLGFLPMLLMFRVARRSDSTSALTTGLYGLIGTFISLIVVAAGLIICAITNRAMVLPFGIAEIIALIAFTSVSVLNRNVLSKRKKKN